MAAYSCGASCWLRGLDMSSTNQSKLVSGLWMVSGLAGPRGQRCLPVPPHPFPSPPHPSAHPPHPCTPPPPPAAAILDLHSTSVPGAALVLRAWLLWHRGHALRGWRIPGAREFTIITGGRCDGGGGGGGWVYVWVCVWVGWVGGGGHHHHRLEV